jgi:hypothetical protein
LRRRSTSTVEVADLRNHDVKEPVAVDVQ